MSIATFENFLNLFCCYCILLGFCEFSVGGTSVKVTLENGSPVIGFQTVSAVNKPVSTFLGIPYAEPPIGKLRFKPPLAKRPWKTDWFCMEPPNACMQVPDTYFTPDFEGPKIWNPNTPTSEDCLYLNVWVPDEPNNHRNSLLPVMVWIYGGGFSSGSIALDVYDGRILSTEQNVVVVSMNYRLNIFGFFALQTTEAPGNQGIMDQQLALRWINRNIRFFGGNPDKITIFGESAGAASVGIHLISPASRNLFNYAILESGTTLAPWAVQPKTNCYNRSLEVAVRFSCYDLKTDHPYTFEEATDCLREVNAAELVKKISFDSDFIDTAFGPIIDFPIIPEHPEAALVGGRINSRQVIFGVNRNEGNYFLVYYLPHYHDNIFNPGAFQRSQQDFDKFMYKILPPNIRKKPAALTIISHEYLSWTWNHSRPMEQQKTLDRIAGDAYFVCPVLRDVNLNAQNGASVYLYEFSQVSSNLPWPKWMGAIHGYELMYIFGEPLIPQKKYNEKEKELSRKIMAYFGNFARTGNPNIKADGSSVTDLWPTYCSEKQQYIKWTTEVQSQFAIRNGLRVKHCYFWNKYLPMLLKGQDVLWGKRYTTALIAAEEELDGWSSEMNGYINANQRNLDSC